MLNLLSAIAALFTKAHVNASAAAAKITTVQGGIQTAQQVVAILPPGKDKDLAMKALDEAASLSATAIIAAHTIEAVQQSHAAPAPAPKPPSEAPAAEATS